jgi:hypothetical protein
VATVYAGPFIDDPRAAALAAAEKAAGRGTANDTGDAKPTPRPTPGETSSKRPKPFTRADWFKAANNRVLNGYLDVRSDLMLQHLIEGGLFPAFSAPVFTPHGGPLPPGPLVTITLPQPDVVPPLPAGEIYYTLNGSDPRKVGGAISSDAQRYVAPFPSRNVRW